jgi:hypothetical protein
VDPKINHCTDDSEKPVKYHKECSASAVQLGLPAAEQETPNDGSSVDLAGSGWQCGFWLGPEALADFSLWANLPGY